MFTCSKVYTDLPFAHRQHRHAGHCQLVHGHNWSVRLTFACRELDANGFVVDFGGLTFIKRWLEENLDHACVFNADDPLREQLVASAPGAWKVHVVDCCSCEGIARHLHGVFDPMVREHSGGRAWIQEVGIEEDSRNSATYRPQAPGAAA